MFSRLFKRKPVLEFDVEGNILGQKYAFVSKENQTLLDAALSQDVPIPHSCQVGSCGECRCRINSGASAPLKDLGYMFEEHELADGYTLACQTLAKSNVTFSIAAMQEASFAKIAMIAKIEENLLSVQIQSASNLEAKVGQYLEVSNLDGLSRYYSIVSLTRHGDSQHIELHISIKSDGEMSQWWQAVMALEHYPDVQIGVPLGNYSVQGQGDVIAVAAGSGLGVTAALLSEHLRQNPTATGSIIGVFKPDSHYFCGVVEKMKERFGERVSAVSVHHQTFYSASSLTQLLTNPIGEKPLEVNGLICGSARLVQHTMDLLMGSGLDKQKVSYDEFV